MLTGSEKDDVNAEPDGITCRFDRVIFKPLIPLMVGVPEGIDEPETLWPTFIPVYCPVELRRTFVGVRVADGVKE